jgi:hypothetical protein
MMGVPNMDYFASTSLSNLEEMIDAENDTAMRQKLLLCGIRRKGKPKRR